jgi:hypothetical protein
MAQINSASKSSRLLASRRYTHDILGSAQEAFTKVLDLNATEIYTETNLIPTSSLPFSGSSQHLSTDPVLRYYFRQKLTPSNVNNEAWFFLEPTGSDNGIGPQLIDSNQQTNFISPKYSEVSLTTANTEDSTPGYGVKVFVSDSTDSASLDAPISINDFQFDYKTGVLQFLNSSVAPDNDEYVYMTAYQYIGKTLDQGLSVEGTLSSSAQIASEISGAFNGQTGSFLLNTTDTLDGDLTITGKLIAQQFVVSSSVTSLITQELSGSTQFGDSSDDTHFFSGSITSSGNISASGYISASSFHGDGSHLTGVTSYSDSDTLSYINNLGILSSSNQLTSSFLEINGDNVISSSNQLTSSFLEIIGDGVISSSNQLTSSFLEIIGDGVISSSNQLTSSFLEINGDNVISSSNQLTSTFLEIEGDSVFSGSSQLTLDLDITASLATEVGSISDDTKISAGTSIESLLRQMLIKFISPTINSFTIRSSELGLPVLSTRLEVGDTDTVDSGTYATSSDSLNGPFNSISITLDENDNNTLSSVTTTGAAITFDSKTIRRLTPGTVRFYIGGEDAQGNTFSEVRNDSCTFYLPIFFGGSPQTADPLNDTELSLILADISGSAVSGYSGVINTNNQSLINSTSTYNLPEITFTVPNNAGNNVNGSSNFTYLIYPDDYGDLSKIIKNGVGDESGTFLPMGTADHERFGVTTTYRVLRTTGQGPYSTTDTITIDN